MRGRRGRQAAAGGVHERPVRGAHRAEEDPKRAVLAHVAAGDQQSRRVSRLRTKPLPDAPARASPGRNLRPADGNHGQEGRGVRDVQGQAHRLRRALWLRQARASGVSHRILQERHLDSATGVQDVQPSDAAGGGARAVPETVPKPALGERAEARAVEEDGGPVQAVSDVLSLRRRQRRGETRGTVAEDCPREVQQEPRAHGGVPETVRGGGQVQRPAEAKLVARAGRSEPDTRNQHLQADFPDGLRASRHRGSPRALDLDAPARAAGVHSPERRDGRRRGVERGRHHDEAHTDHRGEQRAAARVRERVGDRKLDGELGLSSSPDRDVLQQRAPGLIAAVPRPGEAAARVRAASEREARTIQREPVGEARRL